MPSTDQFNLQRFEEAQKGVYDRVLQELQAGRKTSHWIWFIFPQIRGLGSSRMSQLFAIQSLEEARAFVEHPILGPRLRECTRLVLEIQNRSIREILGDPDDLKFRSSTTLFAEAAQDNKLFLEALEKYFDGEKDSATLRKLGIGPGIY